MVIGLILSEAFTFYIRCRNIRNNVLKNLSIEIEQSPSANPLDSALVITNNGDEDIVWHQTRWFVGGIQMVMQGGSGAVSASVSLTNDQEPTMSEPSTLVLSKWGGSLPNFDLKNIFTQKDKNGKDVFTPGVDLVIVFSFKVRSVPEFWVDSKSQRFITRKEGDTFKWYPEPINSGPMK